MSCPMKVKSNTIELTLHTYCYCVFDLLCVTTLHWINIYLCETSLLSFQISHQVLKSYFNRLNISVFCFSSFYVGLLYCWNTRKCVCFFCVSVSYVSFCLSVCLLAHLFAFFVVVCSWFFLIFWVKTINLVSGWQIPFFAWYYFFCCKNSYLDGCWG